MTKLRQDLVDAMIRIYGYENPIVINFCHDCEVLPNDEEHDKTLRLLVMVHEEYPVLDD